MRGWSPLAVGPFVEVLSNTTGSVFGTTMEVGSMGPPKTPKARTPSTLRLVLVGNRTIRRFAAQTWPAYWRARSRWSRIRFLVHRKVFDTRRTNADWLQSASVWRQILQEAVGPLLWAIAVIATLHLSERGAVLMWPAIDPWLRAHTPERATYASLLSTVVQTGGIFLTLYFTTLSLVASTSYARVSNDVRAAVIREKGGSVYLRHVEFVVGYSLLLLGWLSVQERLGFLTFLVVILASTTAIYSFIVLGMRAFVFFDPATLLPQLRRDILSHIRSATTYGYRCSDPSFQTAAQRNAEESMATLRNAIGVSRPPNRAGIPSSSTFAQGIVLILDSYSQQKPFIPRTSRWNKPKLHHLSWLAAGQSRLDIALETATRLIEEKPDYFWLDEQLIDALRKILQDLLVAGHFAAVHSIAIKAQNVILALTSRFQQDEATRLHEALCAVAFEEIRRNSNFVTEVASEVRQYRPETLRLLCLGPISMAIGIAQAAKKLGSSEIDAIAARIVTDEADTAIRMPVPADVAEIVGALRQELEFERAAEGSAVSPRWFVVHHVSLGYAKFFASVASQLPGKIEQCMTKAAAEAVEMGSMDIAVQMIQSGLEAIKKAEYHWRVAIQPCQVQLEQLKRNIGEGEWPAQNEQALATEFARVRARSIAMVAEIAVKLPTVVPTGDLPDNLGFTYTILAEECYAALLRQRYGTFEELFSSYFTTALAAYDRIRAEIAGYDTRTIFTCSADFIVDLFEISGYARVVGSLENLHTWEVVRGCWDTYWMNRADPTALMKQLCEMLDLRSRQASLTTREATRFRWRHEFENTMVDRSLMTSPMGSGAADRSALEPVARVFLEHVRYGGIHAYDVFAAEYLMARPEAAGLGWTRGAKEFRRQLKDMLEERESSGPTDK
jgi:hypothetical protein